MEQQVEFILQTFNGREYEDEERGPRKVVEALFERLRGSKRIVRADKARPARPSYRKPTGPRGSGHDADTIVAVYLTWAKLKGLPGVTCYRENGFAVYSAEKNGFGVRLVSKADFLGDAPEPELES